MSPQSPTALGIHKLVYWTGDDCLDDNAESEDLIKAEGNYVDNRQAEQKLQTYHGESMYVELFEKMLTIVLRDEGDLFTDYELDCFERYNSLNYNARYLFIRLLLRKPAKWHGINTLKYQSDMGNSIHDALKDLCAGPRSLSQLLPAPHKIKVKEEPPEVIDLTVAECVDLTINDTQDNEPKASPAKKEEDSETTESTKPESLKILAQDDNHATLLELLECLTVTQLKLLAKQMKIKAHSKRASLIEDLLISASSQMILSSVKGTGKVKADNLRQTKLPSSWSTNKGNLQTERLRRMVLDILGHCVRISTPVIHLFRRVNLVYLRSTQYSPTLLTESILVKARKRVYNRVGYTRTRDIWPTREALLAYEDALLLEAKVDELLGATPGSASSSPRGRSITVPDAATITQTQTRATSSAEKGKGSSVGSGWDIEIPKESPRVQAARQVKGIFEVVYPQWRALVAAKAEEEGRAGGLERFDCGHILTRIMYKGAHALGLLHEYEAELAVLEELLAQRRWRRGKRGQWHERRALILMTHFPKDREHGERAVNAVIEALEDEDTHLIYRPKLTRRLTTLEKRLKIPLDERHSCEGVLRKSEDVYITGVRVRHKAASLALDQTGRLLNKVTKKEVGRLTQQILPFSQMKNENEPVAGKGEASKSEKWVGKSIWYGRDQEEVTVEILALQHYESLGYRGYHSEGSIVRTLFGLLFWDIIFAEIPGAFETPYQSAPLDIAEDSFYFARKDLINARLTQIEEGEAPNLMDQVDDEHRPTGTWCVGVRWDLFSKEDLLEIAECLGGKALSIICRLLCEDYAGRGGGVPDLIIWNAESCDCKFVEVKGPGDKLQENQKLWSDVLLGAGTVVEVCHVEEQGHKGKKSRTKKFKALAETEESDYSLVESEEENVLGASQPDSSPVRGTKRAHEAGESSGRCRKLPRRITEDFVTSSPTT
ncbi:hypothetical protein NEOLEDRAFT_1110695 [Neolentinus lepideus HHB14362 ss-1]|uniref:Fanconi-associated nuclease n=1 Tax=Neolentinus lepideus HHB14362 ss-1 TaxID=1314782 RepID=A0A165TXK6_9AGAM|nr:hypothetical protein NEOLEDRAFT_1110695 [Neolentinus lepideus HHB14362 ss-1]